MKIKTLHKWLFGLTLIVILISFQGYATPLTKTLTTTEWIVSETKCSEASTFYLFFTAFKLKTTTNSYTNLAFNSFLHTQEICFSLKYKMQNQTFLKLESFNTIPQLKLISTVNTDVFIITS